MVRTIPRIRRRKVVLAQTGNPKNAQACALILTRLEAEEEEEKEEEEEEELCLRSMAGARWPGEVDAR